jgi:hypothetical protein
VDIYTYFPILLHGIIFNYLAWNYRGNEYILNKSVRKLKWEYQCFHTVLKPCYFTVIHLLFVAIIRELTEMVN